MKKNLNLILMLFVTFSLQNAMAQLTGWSTSTARLTIQNGEIKKIVDVSAGIQSVNSSGSNYSLTIKPGSKQGTFTTGDLCLLISMEDVSLTGFHKICNFVSEIGGVITVSPDASGALNPFISKSKLQLLKVNTYKSITLNHGQIICDPYDETKYTGGIIAFICDTMYLNGGYISATGSGVSPYTMNYGNAGVGGVGSNSYYNGRAGFPQVNTPPCHELIGSHKPLVFTHDGTRGDSGLINGSNGSNYTYSPTISNSTTLNVYPTNINMGTPGIIGTSSNSASGGGGGGHGGKGRNLNNTFVNGSPGEYGENGYNSNNLNSRAGGIIIAKIKLLIGNDNIVISNIPRFISNGGYGTNGGQGGFGGNGGNGGLGQIGYCSGDSIFFSGANGGDGKSGKPGNGGAGTNGGQAGSIWYLSNQSIPVIGKTSSTPNFYTQPFAGLFEVNGGKGGKGGTPGLSKNFNKVETQRFDTTNCNPLTWCVDTTIVQYCDCDTVFNELISKSFNWSNPNGIIDFVTGKVYYDQDWGVLKYKKSPRVEYLCPMSIPSQFTDILRLIAKNRNSVYLSNPSIKVKAVKNGNKLRFEDSTTKWPFAEYDFDNNTLTDLDDPARKQVNEVSCLYGFAAFGNSQYVNVGNYGVDGADYQYPGSKSLNPSNLNPYANVVFYQPAPTAPGITGVTDIAIDDIKLYPNPNITSEIIIESNTPIISIQIIDALGKVMIEENFNSMQPKVNIQSLYPATYTIVCKTPNATISKKFIKLHN
jgi:hypothetical protein